MELRIPAVVTLGCEGRDAGLGLGEFLAVVLDFVRQVRPE